MLAVWMLGVLPSCFVVDAECRPYLEESIGGARENLVVTLESRGQRFVVKRTRPSVSEEAMACLRYSAELAVPTTTERRTVNVYFFAASPRRPVSAPNIRSGGLRGDIEQADQDIVCADRAAGLAGQIRKSCLDKRSNKGRGRVIVDWEHNLTFEPASLGSTPEGRCVRRQVRSMKGELAQRRPLQLVAYAESGAVLYPHEQTVDKCDAWLRGIEGYDYTMRYRAEQDDVLPTFRWFAEHTALLQPCFASKAEFDRNGYAIGFDRDREKGRFLRVEFVGKKRPTGFRAACIRRKLMSAKLPILDGRHRDVVAPLSGRCLDVFR